MIFDGDNGRNCLEASGLFRRSGSASQTKGNSSSNSCPRQAGSIGAARVGVSCIQDVSTEGGALVIGGSVRNGIMRPRLQTGHWQSETPVSSSYRSR